MNNLKKILLISALSLTACKDSSGKSFFQALNDAVNKKSNLSDKEEASKSILIKNAKIYTVAGKTYDKASILVEDGLIKKISEEEIKASGKTIVIDGKNKQVTPGLIDVHSHMGVYPNPGLQAHSDGNEAVRKSTASVSAQDSFWPQDPSIWKAIAGGITTIQVLPGSANLVGGTSFTARMLPGKLDPKDMKFPGAPVGMKMACGENPKRVYGKKGGPSTRMGNASEFRKLFQEAKEYAAGSKSKKEGKDSKPGKRNFANENLAKVLSGEILLHIHCYRADDMSLMINIADEFGFKIKTFQHALEAYKIKDRLREKEIGSATWADWWGFKAEAYDGIPYNMAILEDAGAKAIVHSDSATDIRFLNVEAAKAWRSGLELGLKITEEQAMAWITKNAAWSLGIDDKVGTLEEGKFADITIWDGHPFSAYTKTSHVIVDGKIIFDREKSIRPESDFEIDYQDELFRDGRKFNQVLSPQKIIIPTFNQDWFKSSFANPKSFLITNVKFSEDQKNLNHILVRDGVISEVFQKDNFPRSGIEMIDGKGQLLTAGLVESITTLGLFEIGAESSTNDSYSAEGKMTPSLRSIDALNLDGPRIEINRKEGVTTAVSSVATTTLFGESVAFDLLKDGDEFDPAPYLVSTFSKSLYSEKNNSRAEVWRQLRRVASETSSGKNLKTNLLKPSDYKVLKRYFTGKKPWFVHMSRSGDIKKLVRYKKEIEREYGFTPRFVVVGGAEAWKVTALLKAEKIPVILKPTDQSPENFEKIYSRDDLAAFLKAKGVQVIITSSEWDANVRRLRQEAGFAVKYGMKWSDALSSITQTPAEVLNFKSRGRIKVGARANLVLWTGDLFEPYNTAQAIWIDGRRQSLTDRQRKLAEKYK